MKELLFATGNKGKIEEAQAILEVPVEIAVIEVDEVQSMDLEYVSRKKTEAAFRLTNAPVITDDVGVFIEAWNGFPGPFVKYVYTVMGIDNPLNVLKNEPNRNVIVRCAVGYHDGIAVHTFIGEVKGTLAFEQRGSNGWGFDPIIIPGGEVETFAEMDTEKKNRISHRGLAFEKLKNYLDSQK